VLGSVRVQRRAVLRGDHVLERRQVAAGLRAPDLERERAAGRTLDRRPIAGLNDHGLR